MQKLFKYTAISLLLLVPTNTLAYSNEIIPGGTSIGLEIKSDGIMVVGFYKVNGKYIKGSNEIKVGDKITKVEGQSIFSSADLVNEINKHISKGKINLTLTRDNKEFNSEIDIILEDGMYKTGLYVKDEITGIGTLTYIDPTTGIYGSLGHEIVDSTSGLKIEVASGEIFKSKVTGIDRSTSGTPGGKNATFYSSTVYGNIEKNTNKGIYGKYTADYSSMETMQIASLDEVKLGKAYIYTVLNGEEIGKYEINITKINKKSSTKALVFEVVDKEVLEKAGGIVQGMSGSPIIQSDKIIGAVTHVVVSNPNIGYGISIIEMLEEGEK